MRFLAAASAAVLISVISSAQGASAPSADVLKQTLQKRLLELTPVGTTERQVLFQEVTAGRPDGDHYPFMVTAVIRDYGPGYPANHFFGATCVGKMDRWRFDLVDDRFGGWTVEGAMTVTRDQGRECKDNPAAGVSSMPLASLSGTPAPARTLVAVPAATPARATGGDSLYTGEYACYGNGTLLAGAGIKLQSGSRYTDVEGRRGGSYAYNATAATISFTGGFFDGQTGKKVTVRGFELSDTVNCEPWR
jgi:hypothetical protein